MYVAYSTSFRSFRSFLMAFLFLVITPTAELAAAQLTLSWKDLAQNEAGFKIERGVDAAGPFTILASVDANTTSYTDLYLDSSATYCYRVRAFNAAGNSAYSNADCHTPDEELIQGLGSEFIAVNFQPAEISLLPGYVADAGQVYDPFRGYGWDRLLDTRQRGVHSDPLLDSFVFASGTEATWSHDLPNGEYLVSLALNDPSYGQGPHWLGIEDTAVVSGETTTPAGYLSFDRLPIVISDGQLNVTIGGGGSTTVLNYITAIPVQAAESPSGDSPSNGDTEAPGNDNGTPPNGGNETPTQGEGDVLPTSPELVFETVTINFQPMTADIPVDGFADMGDVYDPLLGSGWDHPLDQRERGINGDPYLDTFVFTWDTPATWSYDLPDGEYLISLASGDPGYNQGLHRVEVEGTVLINGANTSADTYVMVNEFPISVTDGQLNVTIGGLAGTTLLNSITIAPIESIENVLVTPATQVSVNFQPKHISAPEGYVSDSGAQYTPELGYGWDQTLAYRERGINPDPRLDTFVFSWETAIWSYDLPNGRYLISLESGDPEYDQGPQRIIVEGTLVVEDVATSADSYMMIQNVPVEVTDGQLNVIIGGTAGPTLLNALTITPAI